MSLQRLFITNILIAISLCSYAQHNDSIPKNVEDIPNKYYSKVNDKLLKVNSHLTKKSLKYLRKLDKQEKNLQAKLDVINPEVSTDLFSGSQEKYNQFASELKSKTNKINNLGSKEYNSYLDTLSTSLSFLKQFKGIGHKSKTPLNSLKQLQGKFQQSENINQFISQRKERIRQVLSQYTHVPAGLKKQFQKLNKTAYYYSAQINEYKETLKDPVKAEHKALSLLNKLPAFQKFIKQNSQLASLFRMPGDPNDPAYIASLTGLQTRSSVQSLIQQQVSSGGPNAQQVIQQSIAQSHSELSKLKDKINKEGGGSSDAEMPDFKPNLQKTKSFLKRLEFGANIQSEKTNVLLPVTSDLALTAGYKLNDKSIIGIGASYKLGWGSGWKHIKLSNEGIGVRSFIDMNLKGSFWLTGGYEQNYQSAFTKITQLKNFNAWQASGLIGMTKKITKGKKIKNLQLLWDFLSYGQRPIRQPIIFRIGYVFK